MFFFLSISYTLLESRVLFLFQQLCVKKESVLVGIIVINNNIKNIYIVARRNVYSNDIFLFELNLTKKTDKSSVAQQNRIETRIESNPFCLESKKHTPYFNFKVKSDSRETTKKERQSENCFLFRVTDSVFSASLQNQHCYNHYFSTTCSVHGTNFLKFKIRKSLQEKDKKHNLT